MFQVDLNADLGESFGAQRLGRDAERLQHIVCAYGKRECAAALP